MNEPWITDKVRIQNGYAYFDHPFWNAEKQQVDHKRKYIGKYDGEDFQPNKNFHRLKAEYEASLTSSKTGLYRQISAFANSMEQHTCLTGLLKRQASQVI